MRTKSITPIHVTSLADTVADRIRKAIITGELCPGERLSESALADQMGVSRSPVREALQILKMNGLVVDVSRRSSHVWSPTPVDVDEIFSLRTMIESLASEWLVRNLSEVDVQAMEKIMLEESLAIADGDAFNILDSDKRFHQYICNRSQHSRLMEWWDQLMWQWEALLYRRIQNNPEQVLTSVIDDHSALLKAMQAHDLKQVADLHRSINQRVANNIKEFFNQEVG